MNSDYILAEIKQLREEANEIVIKRYNFQLTERIVIRLASFSDCNECNEFMEEAISVLKEMNGSLPLPVNKTYSDFIKRVTIHLQKNHKLITESYYTNTYMACGIGIGLPFGFIISQLLGQMAYMGVGLPIGIGIGLSIGSKLDLKAKKDGFVI